MLWRNRPRQEREAQWATLAWRRRSLPCRVHRAGSDRGDAAAARRMPPNSSSGCFAASSRSVFYPGSTSSVWRICRPPWPPRNITICRTGSAASMSNTCMRSDRKAWIRYPPPRWIWRGTAICGIPGEVSRAMLRGWHGNNGVALGDTRLGFVCTKQSVDGQDGLEGYYHLADAPLDIDQRVDLRAGISTRLCSIRRKRLRCRWRVGRSSGWKKPTVTMRWNMSVPQHPCWCRCSGQRRRGICSTSQAS